MRDFAGKPIDLAHIEALLSRVAEERAARPPKAQLVSEPSDEAGAVLSEERLRALEQIERDGEEGFFDRVCRLFLDDTPGRIRRMEDALGRGDARAVGQEAHAIKSASATLGALDMSALCARIEEASRTGRIQDMGGWIEELRGKLGQVERALAARGARPGAAQSS